MIYINIQDDFSVYYKMYIDILKEHKTEYDNFLKFVNKYYLNRYELDLFSVCEEEYDDIVNMIIFFEIELVSVLSKHLDTVVEYEELNKISLNKVLNYIDNPIIKQKISLLSKHTFEAIVLDKIRLAIIHS